MLWNVICGVVLLLSCLLLELCIGIFWNEDDEASLFLSKFYRTHTCPSSVNWTTSAIVDLDIIMERTNDAPSSTILPGPCQDTLDDCTYWASVGECDHNPEVFLEACPYSCDACPTYVWGQGNWNLEAQIVYGPLESEIFSLVQASEKYMHTHVYSQLEGPALHHVQEHCVNRHQLCSYWSLMGECEQNSGFMLHSCGPACQSCHVHGHVPKQSQPPEATVEMDQPILKSKQDSTTLQTTSTTPSTGPENTDKGADDRGSGKSATHAQ